MMSHHIKIYAVCKFSYFLRVLKKQSSLYITEDPAIRGQENHAFHIFYKNKIKIRNHRTIVKAGGGVGTHYLNLYMLFLYSNS